MYLYMYKSETLINKMSKMSTAFKGILLLYSLLLMCVTFRKYKNYAFHLNSKGTEDRF